ncbi:MAG: hypothetical protein FJZ90_00055 [Chloroflexi bacterium]|nr:hypothetical protein [Chloroflexota bacterium]
MSYATVLEGLIECLKTIPDLVGVYDYAPTAIHDTPIIYTFLDRAEYKDAVQIETRHYFITIRLLVRWQDSAGAELEAAPFVNSIRTAVRNDPQFGGRITSGMAQVQECRAVWVTVGGVEYRGLDFTVDISEKAPC